MPDDGLEYREYLNNAPDPSGYEVPGLPCTPSGGSMRPRPPWTGPWPCTGSCAVTSQHRHVRLPDLIISATAELSGATVLHYDAGYDRIAAVTGQPTEWVAEHGST